MRQPKSSGVITRERYDAVLLDLDGVITDTANLHAACWKQMFDEYLRRDFWSDKLAQFSTAATQA